MPAKKSKTKTTTKPTTAAIHVEPRKLLSMIESLRKIDRATPPLDSSASFSVQLTGDDHHALGTLLSACESYVNARLVGTVEDA